MARPVGRRRSVDEPTTFLPSPRAVLLEQSDDEPESPVDRAIHDARQDIEERVEARLSPKGSLQLSTVAAVAAVVAAAGRSLRIGAEGVAGRRRGPRTRPIVPEPSRAP